VIRDAVRSWTYLYIWFPLAFNCQKGTLPAVIKRNDVT
jgi:hypothetical protein